jgi:hypothetical protein
MIETSIATIEAAANRRGKQELMVNALDGQVQPQ